MHKVKALMENERRMKSSVKSFDRHKMAALLRHSKISFLL